MRIHKGDNRLYGICLFSKVAFTVVEISRIDLCTIIYKAFRTFVTSKKYRKVYWQKVSFEETLVDGYGSLEKAL